MKRLLTILLLLLLLYIGSKQVLSQSAATTFEKALQQIDSSLVLENRLEARNLVRQLYTLSLSDYQKYELHLRQKRLSKHQIGISHELISFNGDYPITEYWNTTAVNYQLSIKKHTLLARVSNSERFNNSGLLYELEGYPVISDKLYGFVAISFANNAFNQNFGNALSLYYNLGKGYEVEVGYRYFDFDSDSFVTAAAGITKYVGSFYINARVTLGPENEEGMYQNYQFTARYYFENAANYAFIRLGSGISPDDTNRFTQVASNPSLKAFNASVGLVHWYNHFGFGATAGYLIEDLPQNSTGTQWLGALDLKYRFF